MAAEPRTPKGLLGSVWVIASAEPIEITRPDGELVHVASTGKTCAHVLNQAGTYTASTGDTITVKGSK